MQKITPHISYPDNKHPVDGNCLNSIAQEPQNYPKLLSGIKTGTKSLSVCGPPFLPPSHYCLWVQLQSHSVLAGQHPILL